jgi:hypothetical protein
VRGKPWSPFLSGNDEAAEALKIGRASVYRVLEAG